MTPIIFSLQLHSGPAATFILKATNWQPIKVSCRWLNQRLIKARWRPRLRECGVFNPTRASTSVFISASQPKRASSTDTITSSMNYCLTSAGYLDFLLLLFSCRSPTIISAVSSSAWQRNCSPTESLRSIAEEATKCCLYPMTIQF